MEVNRDYGFEEYGALELEEEEAVPVDADVVLGKRRMAGVVLESPTAARSPGTRRPCRTAGGQWRGLPYLALCCPQPFLVTLGMRLYLHGE